MVSVELAFDDLGRGAPWVFLHGFPLTRKLWEPQHALADRARLLLPDLRGHGGSPHVTPATMEAMAEDVLALCDAQGVERFGLLGLSMGGYVALELQRIAPTRVERLVLAATQAAPDTPEQRDGREKLARELDGDGIQPLLDAFLPKLLSERAQLDAVLESKVRALIVSNAPDAMAAALRGMAQRRDHRARLASVACPVLVIAGSDDKAVPPARSQEMAQALPNARLVDVPGVGHLVNLEAPEAFNAALHSFMAEAEVAVSSR